MKQLPPTSFGWLIFWISLVPLVSFGQSTEIALTPVDRNLLLKNDSRTPITYFLDARELMETLEGMTSPEVSMQKSFGSPSIVEISKASIIDLETTLYTIDNYGIAPISITPSDFISYYGESDDHELALSSYKGSLPYGYVKSKNQVVELDPTVNKNPIYKNGNATLLDLQGISRIHGACHNHGVLSPIEMPIENDKEKSIATRHKSNSQKIVELTIILDHAYIEQNGGVENSIAKSLGVINSIHTNFDNEFDADITFKVRDIVISNCSSCDPWSEETNIGALLLEVNDWAITQDYLERNDAVLFWTGRDIEGDAIGSAYTGSLCSEVSTIVLEDLSNSPWELRVLASHELGHALSSEHDHESSPTIMAPELTNSNNWSAITKNNINSFIQSNNCISNEAAGSCPSVTNITATILQDNQLDLAWDVLDGVSTDIQIVDLSNQQLIYQVETTDKSILVLDSLRSCRDYRVVLSPSCSGGQNLSAQIVISTKRESQLQLIEVVPSACYIAAGTTLYDLNFTVVNNEESLNGNVIIGDIEVSIALFSGTHTYQVFGLMASNLNTDISVNSNLGEAPSCLSVFTFKAPGAGCALDYNYDFNDCQLPDGWQINSSGNSHEGFKWDIRGSDRGILNYGNSQNANTSKTIDGSCMLLIDDDMINNAGHTGTTWLSSPPYDLSDYDNIGMSFDHIFDNFHAKGANSSELSVEVWDGIAWRLVYAIDQGSCNWYNVWSLDCVERISIDLSGYKNSQFKVRWAYSDGGNGQWTGMAALDNIQITASQKNNVPCGVEEYSIVEGGQMKDTLQAKNIYVSAVVDRPAITLQASSLVVLEPGASIVSGASLEVNIEPCVD